MALKFSDVSSRSIQLLSVPRFSLMFVVLISTVGVLGVPIPETTLDIHRRSTLVTTSSSAQLCLPLTVEEKLLQLEKQSTNDIKRLNMNITTQDGQRVGVLNEALQVLAYNNLSSCVVKSTVLEINGYFPSKILVTKCAAGCNQSELENNSVAVNILRRSVDKCNDDGKEVWKTEDLTIPQCMRKSF